MQKRKSQVSNYQLDYGINKWNLQFKSPIHEKLFLDQKVLQEKKIFLLIATALLGSLSIYQLVYEQSITTVAFLAVSILLILGLAFLKKHYSYLIFVSQIVLIAACGYYLKYLKNINMTKNQAMQIGQVCICMILIGTGQFLLDLLVQLELFIVSIVEIDQVQFDNIYVLILIHIIFFGVKYHLLKKLKGLSLIQLSLNELQSFINTNFSLGFFMSYLDPITSDFQIVDFNQALAKIVGDTNNLKGYVSQIKIDLTNSDLKDNFSKKELSLKDYLMQKHWMLNDIIQNRQQINNKYSRHTNEQNNLQRSTLDYIKTYNVNNIQPIQNIQAQQSESPFFNRNNKKQLSNVYMNQTKKSKASSVENASFAALNKLNQAQNNQKRSSENLEQAPINNNQNEIQEQLKLLNKVDTLQGFYQDETSNKKIHFKMKVRLILMERPYIGVTLENLTDKREMEDIKMSINNQLTIYQQSLIQMKMQAIETIKICKQIHPSQMVPLLSQINLMDYQQEYLLKREETKTNKIRKSPFNLKSLLKEIEDIFQIQVMFKGELLQNQNSIHTNSSNKLISAINYQQKPQRDSLFAKWKNNIIDTNQNTQQASSLNNQNPNSNNGSFSKENTQNSNNQVGKLFEDINSGNSVLNAVDDQFIVNNDIQKVRQILIALVTNMITWYKILIVKKPSFGDKSNIKESQIDFSPIELICTEEQNQFFEFYKLKLILNCQDAPFTPSADDLLKYLNGIRDIRINYICKRIINLYVQLIGPYKINSQVVDGKTIEISFDLFKDLEIIENRDLSQMSQSQICSFQLFTNPPLTATRNSINQLNSYVNSGQRQFRQFHQRSKKTKTLSNSITLNYFQKNLTHIKQINFEQQYEMQDQAMPSPNKQLGESERLYGELNEHFVNANDGTPIDLSLRQPQINLQNSIFNLNSIRDSQQLYSNSPDQITNIDQSEDMQNSKSPDINSAMKTLFNRVSTTPQSKQRLVPKKQLIQIIQKKSKSSTNLENLSDSNVSNSVGNSYDDHYNQQYKEQQNQVNQTVKMNQIHTISSINQHQI
ncbi:hypothetical protein ABPG74_003949 [Tetrahymena malaccensis]